MATGNKPMESDPILDKLNERLKHQYELSEIMPGQALTEDDLAEWNMRRGFFLKYSKHYKREQVKEANKMFDQVFGLQVEQAQDELHLSPLLSQHSLESFPTCTQPDVEHRTGGLSHRVRRLNSRVNPLQTQESFAGSVHSVASPSKKLRRVSFSDDVMNIDVHGRSRATSLARVLDSTTEIAESLDNATPHRISLSSKTSLPSSDETLEDGMDVDTTSDCQLKKPRPFSFTSLSKGFGKLFATSKMAH